VFFGLIADRAIVDEPRRLADRFGREFEHLLLATTTGLLGLRRSRRKKTPAAST
jgi:hypothetical protein